MYSTAPIRIMVVEDSATVRRFLAVILRSSDGLELVAIASDGAEAVQICEQVQPDVILMDLHMRHMDGVTATRILHERYPQLKILVLTAFTEDSFVQEALRAGAMGYLFKNVAGAEIIAAIQAACQGQPAFVPDDKAAVLKGGVHLAV